MDKLKDFGFLLKDLSRRYVLRFEQHASEMSLTLMQCKALAKLEVNEGASQVRLAELTDVDSMTMVRILDKMESDKLIERRPDPEDRRARRLFLTDKGRPLVAEIWRLAEVTRAEMFAGISAAHREIFMDVLSHLHANATAVEGSPVDTAKPLPALAATHKRTRAAGGAEPVSN
jgi:MarR family transcriptional regulator for hemolysin